MKLKYPLTIECIVLLLVLFGSIREMSRQKKKMIPSLSIADKEKNKRHTDPAIPLHMLRPCMGKLWTCCSAALCLEDSRPAPPGFVIVLSSFCRMFEGRAAGTGISDG